MVRKAVQSPHIARSTLKMSYLGYLLTHAMPLRLFELPKVVRKSHQVERPTVEETRASGLGLESQAAKVYWSWRAH